MARSDNMLTLLVLGIGGYLVYTHYLSPAGGAAPPGTAAQTGMLCKFPDGTTAPIGATGSCPFDSSHGGQSTPCYPSTFVGPMEPGSATC